MMIDDLARRFGLTPRQIRYWRRKGYVAAARKDGRTWIYEVESVRRLALIAHLLKAGATPQSVLAAVRGLEANAERWLSASLWKVKVYVVGAEILATNGKILVNPVTGELAMPVLFRQILSQVKAVISETHRNTLHERSVRRVRKRERNQSRLMK